MATNTNLTRALAVELLRQKEVVCPACGRAVLTPRYSYKAQNVEYKCIECGEVYRPYKLI